MWSRFHPSPALIVACLALIVALGGTSYAVSQLPDNSVGTRQLKDGAVSAAKLRPSLRAAASSSSFSEALPSGRTLRGFWHVEAYVEGNPAKQHAVTGAISFGHKLSKAPQAHLILQGGAATPECPGTAVAPRAARGHLCLYAAYDTKASFYLFDTRLTSVGDSATPFGVGILATATGPAVEGDYYGGHGTWAVRAK
jgi:hypothetical protein